MKLGVRRLIVGVGSLALIAGGMTATGMSAQAATPPYEPDPGSFGSIAFYDAAGHVVTSGGINDAPFASYVLASHAGRAGDTKATLFGYLPKLGVPSGSWSGEGLTASTNYPNASAPALLNSSALPLVSLNAADSTLSTLISDFPNTATDAYQGLYQLRLKTSGVGQPADATYSSADIFVSGSTWTQVYPVVAQSTTTALAVTPASPQPVGSTLTLKATITPPGAAGSVQFKDGATNVGSAVAVSGGIAQITNSSLAAGAHSLTAEFTPTDPAAFAGSTSSAVAYTISSLATTTTTALAVTPASPQLVGTTLTIKATVTPSGAVGSVQFKDGVTNLGSPVAVSGGIAQITNSTLAAGTHSLTAVFTPTNAALFTGSTSPASSLVVNAATTTTALTVTPASPVGQGTTVTLKATLTPSTATGTVQFKDGATSLGSPATVSAGIATLSTTTLTVATHSLTAAYTPTGTSYVGSTSNTVSYEVTTAVAVPTTLTSHVSPSSVTYGSGVTLSGSLHRTGDGIAVAGAAIDVQYKTPAATSWTLLRTVHTSASGGWTTTTTPTANRSYRAVFAGDATALASTSSAVSVTVKPKVTLKIHKKKVELGGKVKFKGKVSPVLKGRVSLQRFSGGKWVTVTTKAIKSTGKFSIGWKPKSTKDYKFRVVLPASANYGTGVSPTRKLTVT